MINEIKLVCFLFHLWNFLTMCIDLFSVDKLVFIYSCMVSIPRQECSQKAQNWKLFWGACLQTPTRRLPAIPTGPHLALLLKILDRTLLSLVIASWRKKSGIWLIHDHPLNSLILFIPHIISSVFLLFCMSEFYDYSLGEYATDNHHSIYWKGSNFLAMKTLSQKKSERGNANTARLISRMLAGLGTHSYLEFSFSVSDLYFHDGKEFCYNMYHYTIIAKQWSQYNIGVLWEPFYRV